MGHICIHICVIVILYRCAWTYSSACNHCMACIALQGVLPTLCFSCCCCCCIHPLYCGVFACASIIILHVCRLAYHPVVLLSTDMRRRAAAELFQPNQPGWVDASVLRLLVKEEEDERPVRSPKGGGMQHCAWRELVLHVPYSTHKFVLSPQAHILRKLWSLCDHSQMMTDC